MRTRFLFSLLCSLYLGIPAPVAAQYVCDTTVCRLPDCHCADTAPPGGLAPQDVPQFILVTFDDAVHSYSEHLIGAFLTDVRNPDGRLAPATYFINETYTMPHLVRARYEAGHEIANHTASHTTSNETSSDAWHAELAQLEALVVDSLQIPRDQLQGFRAPFLATNQAMWDALAERNYLYDSSVPEQVMMPPLVSTSQENYVWPHTLDYGMALSCYANICPARPIPGLWTIPMWAWTDKDGTLQGVMDPAIGSAAPFADLLNDTFDARYNGNRAPIGLYLHAGQTAHPGRPEALHAFLTEKLTMPDVWMITMRGLIEWMRNPVPAPQIAGWFADNCHRGYCRDTSTNARPETPDTLVPSVVYPNPTFGNATLKVTLPGTALLHVELFDVLGRVVYHQLRPPFSSLTLPLENQPCGTYFYRLRNETMVLTEGVVIRR